MDSGQKDAGYIRTLVTLIKIPNNKIRTFTKARPLAGGLGGYTAICEIISQNEPQGEI